MSGQRGVRLVVLAQRSEGCLVRPGVNQRVFQKVVYVWWSHIRLPIWFAERTFSGAPLYVHTTNSSVRLPDLAYVHPIVQIAPLVSLVTQSSN